MDKFIMKKLPIVILFLTVSMYAVAQENKSTLSIGIGPEFNMNSRHNFAGGTVFGFYFNLPGKTSSLGLTSTVSSNFVDTQVIEAAALFRWYLQNPDYTGYFIQAETGVFTIFEDGERILLPIFGVRGGYRLPITSFFYVEPNGRLGYPFAFGIAVMAGITF